jgi:hypothetical protein
MSAEDVDNDVDNEEEALEHAAEEVSKEERRGSVLLWFAVLGSPIAWVGHLGIGYSLEEWFACSESAHEEGHILGFGVKAVSVFVNSAMAGLALLSLLAGLSCWRKLKGKEGDERLQRAQWMAFAGIVEGALFLFIILLGYLPALTLHTCETTP